MRVIRVFYDPVLSAEKYEVLKQVSGQDPLTYKQMRDQIEAGKEHGWDWRKKLPSKYK